MPFVNWTLFVAVVALVLFFRSSSGLASAYGLAVTATMLIDSVLVLTVAYGLSWLMPARRDLWRMGGSHAQRDIFIQLLADACQKPGRSDYLSILFDDNVKTGFERVRERSFYRTFAS